MAAWRRHLTTLGAIGLVLYLAPPVRVTPLGKSPAASAVAFNASDFAQRYWSERLLPAARDSTDAADLVAKLVADPADALELWGRNTGVGRGGTFLTQGEGKVEAMEKSHVVLSVTGGDLRLRRGPLFGSTLRDAADAFVGAPALSSRDANAVAAEVNHLAREATSAALDALAAGDRVRFAGAAKLTSPQAYKPPLEVLPVWVEKQ